jgi:hypothetical protein
MVGPQQISFGEVALLFICQECSSFHSYQKPSVLLFLLLLLVFVFALICIQIFLYLFIKVYFSSNLYWFSSKEVFIKISNGVGKEKKPCAKKWYKKELV